MVTHHPGSPQRWGGFDDLDAEELAEVTTDLDLYILALSAEFIVRSR